MRLVRSFMMGGRSATSLGRSCGWWFAAALASTGCTPAERPEPAERERPAPRPRPTTAPPKAYDEVNPFACIREPRPLDPEHDPFGSRDEFEDLDEAFSAGVPGVAIFADGRQEAATVRLDVDLAEVRMLEVVQRPTLGRMSCRPWLRIPYAIEIDLKERVLVRHLDTAEGVLPSGRFSVSTPVELEAGSLANGSEEKTDATLYMRFDLRTHEVSGTIGATDSRDTLATLVF